MPDLLRHVRALADEIGPRGATGAGEAQAARYVAKVAHSFTHQVWTEPFRSCASAVWSQALVLATALVAGLLLSPFPALSLTMGLLAAVFFVDMGSGRFDLGWVLARNESQNVVAVVPARLTIRERLVLVAYCDTGLESPPRRWLAGTSWLRATAGAVLLLPLLSALRLLVPQPAWGWLALPAVGMVAGAIAADLRHRWLGRPTCGAAAGAAGVAVALQSGTILARQPLRHTEVWLVFTGCRESGMAGVRAFLDRHGHMLADAHFVMLDSLGRGRLAYTLSEGPIRPLAADAGMVSLVRSVTGEHPEWGVTGIRAAGRHSQASAALVRGYRAITLLAAEPGGGTPAQPPPGDPSGAVDPVLLHNAVRLVTALAEQIDRRTCPDLEAGGAG